MSFATARVNDIGDALTIGGGGASAGFGTAIVAAALVVEGGGCSAEVCGITDTFNRTVGIGSLGNSDSGLAWENDLETAYDDPPPTFTPITPVDHGVAPGGAYFNFYEITAAGESVAGTSHSSRLRIGGVYPREMTFEVSGLFYGETGGDPVTGLKADTCSIQCGAAVSFGFQQASEFGPYGWYLVMQGTSFLLSGYVPGEHIFLKLLQTATSTDAKVWRAASSEPGAYQLSVATGGAGLMTFSCGVTTTANEGPLEHTIYLHMVDITGINRCTEYRFDNFSRTVGSGWGTSDYGLAWLAQYASGGASSSVASGLGVITLGGSGQFVMETEDGPSPWSTGKFVMTAVVANWATRNEALALFLRNPAAQGVGEWSTWVFFANSSSADSLAVENASDPPFERVFVDDAADLQGVYNIVWDYEVGVHSKLKWWLYGTAEPAGWQLERSAAGDAHPDETWVFGVNPGNYTKQFLSIDFAYDGKSCYLGGPLPN